MPIHGGQGPALWGPAITIGLGNVVINQALQRGMLSVRVVRRKNGSLKLPCLVSFPGFFCAQCSEVHAKILVRYINMIHFI